MTTITGLLQRFHRLRLRWTLLYWRYRALYLLMGMVVRLNVRKPLMKACRRL